MVLVPDRVAKVSSTSKITGTGILLTHAAGRLGESSLCKRRSELDNSSFYGAVPRGRRGGAFLFYLEGSICSHCAVVDSRQPRDRDVLSPVADAPRIQDLQVGGIFPDFLRHACAGRWADFLGGDAPHTSSVFRSGR